MSTPAPSQCTPKGPFAVVHTLPSTHPHKHFSHSLSLHNTHTNALQHSRLSCPIALPFVCRHVDRLDALMIAGRIGSYCDEINAFAGQNFSKLFLASSLRKPLVAAAAGAGAGAGAAY